jgi:hypothetical protein
VTTKLPGQAFLLTGAHSKVVNDILDLSAAVVFLLTRTTYAPNRFGPTCRWRIAIFGIQSGQGGVTMLLAGGLGKRIDLTIGSKPAFSIRRGFSVSTGCRKETSLGRFTSSVKSSD